MRGRKLLSATALTAAALLVGSVVASPPAAADDISSLRGKSPKLPDFGDIVANRTALRVLGKAWFWDSTVGSDGFACASCHFHAGADVRIVNQFNPGGTADNGSLTYDPGHGVNVTATPDLFPFFKLNDGVEDNIGDEDLFGSNSEEELRNPLNVERDGDDRFSSNGTFTGEFQVGDNTIDENFDPEADEVCNFNTIQDFHPNFQFDTATGTFATRKVEPRQTPSVVNAVFNFRQFWDGRANSFFNGVDPFGERTNKAGIGGVLKLNGGVVGLEELAIRNASLASQAVGPVLSTFEMSCEGRSFAFVGRKILAQRALETQAIDPRDSVFRPSGLIRPDTGLDATYAELVQSAFNPAYWDDGRFFDVDRSVQNGTVNITEVADETVGFSLIEQNFPLFWGLALHEYQASLVSDASDFDRNRLSASARRGKAVFEGKGKCVACHKGALLSGAAVTSDEGDPLIEGMILASETNNSFAALYDDSFYNLGVSPSAEDLGVGDVDPFNNPLSFTRQFTEFTRPNSDFPGFTVNIVDQKILDDNNDGIPDDGVITFEDADAEAALTTNGDGTFVGQRDAVDGAFKTPILRNVGTTPPYMHDGSMATLDEVIDFYNRGGNRLRTNDSRIDTTGMVDAFPNNLDADIDVLHLTESEQEDLKNFMLSLTDPRVLCHRAPFDHPELELYLGHLPQEGELPLRAEDIEAVLPAVGSRGYARRDCFANTGDLFDVTERIRLRTEGGILDPEG